MTVRQLAGTDQRHHIYVVDRFPSYSETFVATEISSLAALGTAVSVYSLHPPKARFPGAASYLARPQGVLRMLPWALPGLLLLVSNFARGLSMEPRSLPKLIFASMHAARLAGTLLILRRAREQQLVLHAHFLARPADVVGLAAIWVPGAPVLVTSHAGDAKDRRDPKLRRWRLGVADHVLAASNYVLGNLAGECPRATIVHCGIDTAKLSQIRPLMRKDDSLGVATVARLIPTKGYRRAIAILLALGNMSKAPITWHIVGDGPMRQDIEDARDALFAAGVTVELHGALDHESTLQILATADVFLLPSELTKTSKNAGDGIPVAILEGMFLGKLVVTTNAGGIPEAVVDQETGLLVTTETDAEIAQRIMNVLSDNGTLNRLCAQAQKKIEKDFEATVSAIAIQEIVSSIIEEPGFRAKKSYKAR